MTKPMIWINGRFYSEAEAKVPVSDRGFLYGDSLFETMRAYAGCVFMADRHLKRFFGGLKKLGIKMPYSREEIFGAIRDILQKNRIKSAYLRVAVSRGQGSVGLSRIDKLKPNVVIIAKEYSGYPERMHKEGISVKVIGEFRVNELSGFSDVKSGNYLPYIMARLRATEEGYDDAVLVNTKGHIVEGATSNIFFVRKGKIATPGLLSGCLPGITRGVIIDIARRLGFTVNQRPLRHRAVFDADEAFFTNSMVEVLPVTKIDSVKIGKGLPGEITKLFKISYQKEVIRQFLGRSGG